MRAFRNKWLIAVLLLLPAMVLTFYWVKLQLGIDLFDTFSLGSRFPLKYVINDVIEAPEHGVLLDENFENRRRILASPLQVEAAQTISRNESADGGHDGSRCLLIDNSSPGYWVSAHNRKVAVEPGNFFFMEGFVKMTGGASQTFLSVTTYDRNENVIKLNDFKSGITITGKWVKIEKLFQISGDDINYIRFRLVGRGKGVFRIDNVVFRKVG